MQMILFRFCLSVVIVTADMPSGMVCFLETLCEDHKRNLVGPDSILDFKKVLVPTTGFVLLEYRSQEKLTE